MTSPKPSAAELQALRMKAAAEGSLSLEETRQFVLASRVSFLAAEANAKKPSSRIKKAGTLHPRRQELQVEIDFF